MRERRKKKSHQFLFYFITIHLFVAGHIILGFYFLFSALKYNLKIKLLCLLELKEINLLRAV